jgi:hypothetical protein
LKNLPQVRDDHHDLNQTIASSPETAYAELYAPLGATTATFFDRNISLNQFNFGATARRLLKDQSDDF